MKYGTVTIDNIDEVAEKLKQLLEGKQFTTVCCYEYRNWEPEVRLHQYLDGGRDGENIRVIHHHLEPDGNPDNPHSQITVCDSYGVWGISTTQTETRYDPDFNAPYVAFEWDRVTITARAPNDLKYYSVYVVEGNSDD